MFNIKLKITYDNRRNSYNLEVGEIEGMLFITKIKTNRQRNFRTLKEFYRESNNIKVNKIDSLFESFGRSKQDVYERFEEENELIEKLGIDKTKVAELFKKELIKKIEKKEFK